MCVCGGGPCRLPAPGPRPTLIRACLEAGEEMDVPGMQQGGEELF